MQMKSRQFLALVLSGLMLAVLLAACGDPTATTAPSNTVAVGTAASTTAAASTTTAAAAATTAASATTAAAAATTAASATTAAAATTAASATTAAAATTAAGGAATTAASGSANTLTVCDKPSAAASNGKVFKVGIAVQNTIPDLVSAINGFKKGMEQCGFVDGKNVKYDLQNAQGDIPSLAIVGKKFVGDQDDIILAVGTAALTNMYNAAKDTTIPIIFNSVTNPVIALPTAIKSETDKGNMTGIQALVDVEGVMKLIPELKPGAKNVGLIYNPAEANSKFLRDESVKVAEKLGLKLVEASISKSDEVQTAALSLADKKVDVFYTTTDVTVVNALQALLKVSNDNKIPIISSNPTAATQGVPVAYGLDYYDIGLLSAPKAVQILEGKKAADLPYEKPKQMHLYINMKGADNVGIKIPDSIVSRAEQKLTEIKSS